MNKIALWINLCADDWIDEMSTIASNELMFWKKTPKIPSFILLNYLISQTELTTNKTFVTTKVTLTSYQKDLKK